MPGRKKFKTDGIRIRVKRGLRIRLEQLAEGVHETVSVYVHGVLERHVRSKGLSIVVDEPPVQNPADEPAAAHRVTASADDAAEQEATS